MRIAIYPAQAGKVWNGATLLTEPLGGSETAVIYVAQELAKLGHEVIVFTKAEPGLSAEVLYLPFEQARAFLRTTPVDALICSRDAMPLLWQTQAPKKLLWLHDLPQGRLPDCDGYVCVSTWQANVYLQHHLLPQEKTRVIHNGIDPDLFTGVEPWDQMPRTPDDEVQLVWTSNPERGLWHAAEVARRVRRHYPKTQLHVFGRNTVYGWNTGYEHSFHPDDLTGVVFHDAMPKAELAQELRLMDLWVYPTWWPETYCIAAVEAQAAGIPVVASNFGALMETCATQRLATGSMRDDPPGEQVHLDAITQAVLDLLPDVKERTRLATDGRAFALTETWAAAAKRWETLLLQ